jgi:hypothetical protein
MSKSAEITLAYETDLKLADLRAMWPISDFDFKVQDKNQDHSY